MSLLLVLELISVVFDLVFLVLLIKEQKQCWIYGIIGSLLGAYVIYQNGYYSETLLYLFYAAVGGYGYYYWDKHAKQKFTIKRTSVFQVIGLVAAGILGTISLGYLMSKTEASKPYYDALSTVFGVLATFLELYKYFVAWSFWILINGYTIWLYGIKELNFMAIKMMLYTALSIYGLIVWRKKLTS
jgi:nicotinamide mononucleotide transporter